MSSKLAINGGTPVRNKPLPSISDISGRTFGDEELAGVTEVLKTGKLFRFGGHYVQDYEKRLGDMLGLPHVVAVTSGTAAIHTAVAALDLEPGDEIIVPPITDMGSIAPIIMQNCIPVFADIDPRSFCLDPESVRANITDRTRAVICVHLAGNMCDVDAIRKVCEGKPIRLVEDCAQAYLSEDNGRLSGTIGDIGCFSLQQSKHIATGDGGAIATRDEDLGWRAAMFMDKGWDRVRGGREYYLLGLNYRMNELTGAVAFAQLAKLPGAVASRRSVADRLTKALSSVRGITVPYTRPGVKHSWWFYPMLWDSEGTEVSLQDFCKAVGAEGVPLSAGYIGHPIFDTPCMREHKTYGKSGYPFGSSGRNIEYRNEDVPAACHALDHLAIAPVNENFTDSDVNDIAEAVAKVAGSI